MSKKLTFLLLFFVFLNPFLSLAQIDISFPVARVVFQRDLNNSGLVPIAGNYTVLCDKVEARLSPLQGYAGTDTDWKTIKDNPEGGIYSGEITAKGGWYNLEVRCSYLGNVVGYTTLQRVGVGEVFIVSGQSNAEGNEAFLGANLGPTDDRISVVNYKDIFLEENILPFEFTSLKTDIKIGPYNPLPWIWGIMAERIVQKYQVPVLIFGAAVGGMGSDFWYRSSKGEDLSQDFGLQVKFSGSPYSVISRTLKNYISRTGARALLWQQGESDFLNTDIVYFNNIKHIMEQTRYDIQDELPWIVARSSRTPNPSFNVINAQNQLINFVPKTYPGPDTDQLFGEQNRFDGIHFSGEGIVNAGNLWFEAIDSRDLLNGVQPIFAKKIPEILISCSNDNKSVKIELKNKNQKPLWSNGSTNESIELQNGSTSAIVRDNIGIRYNFPTIRINSDALQLPSIRALGSTTFCEGEKVEIVAENSFNPKWSNGATQNVISIDKSGEYSFETQNLYGCKFNSSKIKVEVKEKPIPQFSSFNSAICSGDSLIIQTTQNFSTYTWSDGDKSPTKIIKEKANISLKVTAENGCISEEFPLNVEVYDAPADPSIFKSSNFFLSSTENRIENEELVWFKNDSVFKINTPEIKINGTGNYYSQLTRTYQLPSQTLTCTSPISNKIFLEIDPSQLVMSYPNPSTGKIFIETLEDYDDFKLFIYDHSGKTIANETFGSTQNRVEVDLSAVPNGIYTLFIKTKYDTLRKNLLIQK